MLPVKLVSSRTWIFFISDTVNPIKKGEIISELGEQRYSDHNTRAEPAKGAYLGRQWPANATI